MSDSGVSTGPLGLPAAITACLFDLDGVLTQTATVHRAAWKQTFDPLLARIGQRPFSDEDYNQYVDGRRREDGVRAFLASRDLHPPEGRADDPPGADTIAAIAARKNELVLRHIEHDGVQTYDGSVRFLHAARAAGLAIAVVTASANAASVLRAVGLADQIDARIDGVVAAQQNLAGKPAPDSFLAGARALGVEPSAAVVFEDALAGVAAGRAGGFGWVVGVDRVGHRQGLLESGADIVVDDLSELMSTTGSLPR